MKKLFLLAIFASLGLQGCNLEQIFLEGGDKDSSTPPGETFVLMRTNVATFTSIEVNVQEGEVTMTLSSVMACEVETPPWCLVKKSFFPFTVMNGKNVVRLSYVWEVNEGDFLGIGFSQGVAVRRGSDSTGIFFAPLPQGGLEPLPDFEIWVR